MAQAPRLSVPIIPLAERTPTVELLLAIIEHQHATIAALEQRVSALDAEVRRLKHLPPRPNIKPSALDKSRDDDEPPPSRGGASARKRPGSNKRRKRVKVHRCVIITPETLPEGSRLRSYQDFFVQDLLIEPLNTRYRLARYQTPTGEHLVGKLPEYLNHAHFGPTLISYIVHQHHHQRVTQPLLLSQLRQWGVEISSGQLNRVLIEHNDAFHREKDQLLPAGLAASTYVHVDDTGARHRGQNGYAAHIGNEHFAFFASTASKSRINFLELLRTPYTDYHLNQVAWDYLREHMLPHTAFELLRTGAKLFDDHAAWLAQLEALNITDVRHRRIAAEGALIASLHHHALHQELVIVSDDAGQFDVLRHALCWIHAERNIQSIPPLNELHVAALHSTREALWRLYHQLKAYKLKPNPKTKRAIKTRFDTLCKTKTDFQTLNQALKRLHKNKAELLLVLERPDIPLHNNLSERDIREYVIKRKISGSTRSEDGRRARDTFASLKKTCQKLGIGFWDYLLDRFTLSNDIPPLPQLVTEAASRTR